MAILHLKVGTIIRGTAPGGSTGFAQYIARDNVTHTTQHARYLTREQAPDPSDLVAAGAANLPAWAPDAATFWRQADTFERQGGIVARTWEIALPHELSPAQRRDLADDIRAVHFPHHVHSWAIHNPRTRDGLQEQPHLHVMVSERRLDGYDRPPKQFFSRAATAGRDPQHGGAPKDLRWNQRERLREIRASVALLINASLERHGHQVAVSPGTLEARGFQRRPEREQTAAERFLYAKKGIIPPQWQALVARREDLRANHYPWEREVAVLEWHQTRAERQLHDLSREAMRAYCTAQFWHRDSSPAWERHQAQALAPQATPPRGRLAELPGGTLAPSQTSGIPPAHRLAQGVSLSDVLVEEATPAGHTHGPQLHRVHRDHDREASR